MTSTDSNLEEDLDDWVPERPDISHLIIEDDEPVDSIFSEKQMRLLTESLYSSWPGPGAGRTFLAAANVGVFPTPANPALVPDVMVVVDTTHLLPRTEKRNKTYLVWEHGKPPDVVVEIVSNKKGGELSTRLRGYERMRVPYYVVFDPDAYLSEDVLMCFQMRGAELVKMDAAYFETVKLGLKVWSGTYEDYAATYVRWTNHAGALIPTGKENLEDAHQKAEDAHQKAEDAEKRAAALAAKLRELGVDPNSIEP
ncbi:MAG: Uma2 family endonuclease [Myxococcota bacterium]